VSRVDPESTGLNPAWRKSMVLASTGTTWQDGANLTEIQAARRLLIQDVKILEGIAPESGAYLNEVRLNCMPSHPHLLQPHFFFSPLRLRDTSSTGRNPSSALTTTNSEPSSTSTTRNHSSSFTKVSDQTSGTQTSSAKYETHRLVDPSLISCGPDKLDVDLCYILINSSTDARRRIYYTGRSAGDSIRESLCDHCS